MERTIEACTFVALDLETTGLYAATCHIVEIGAVRFNWQAEEAQFQSLVDPRQPIPAAVIAVHGIQDEMVKGQPVIAEILPHFLSFIEGAVLLAHNAAFDAGFLSYTLGKQGYPVPNNLILDTCQLSRKYIHGSPKHSLEHLVRFLSLSHCGQAHRALSDSLACAHVFRQCVAQMPQQQHTSFKELLTQVPKSQVAFYGSQLPQGEQTVIAEQILSAIQQKQDVQIAYHNARNHRTERQVTPIYLGGYGKYLYLEAYCHLRQEQRQFRLDRIQGVH